MSTAINTENDINRAATVIWAASGDAELGEKHFRYARALAEANCLANLKIEAVGRRAMNCVLEFDGVRSGSLTFDDAIFLAEHILAATPD